MEECELINNRIIADFIGFLLCARPNRWLLYALFNFQTLDKYCYLCLILISKITCSRDLNLVSFGSWSRYGNLIMSRWSVCLLSLCTDLKSVILSLGIRSYSPVIDMIPEWILLRKACQLINWTFYRAGTIPCWTQFADIPVYVNSLLTLFSKCS